jgi:hypothetical protein
VNKPKSVGKSTVSPFRFPDLSTVFKNKNRRGEQVCFVNLSKFHPGEAPAGRQKKESRL